MIRLAEIVCFGAHAEPGETDAAPEKKGSVYEYGAVEEIPVGRELLMAFRKSVRGSGRCVLIVAGWKSGERYKRGEVEAVKVRTLDPGEKIAFGRLLAERFNMPIQFWD